MGIILVTIGLFCAKTVIGALSGTVMLQRTILFISIAQGTPVLEEIIITVICVVWQQEIYYMIDAEAAATAPASSSLLDDFAHPSDNMSSYTEGND